MPSPFAVSPQTLALHCADDRVWYADGSGVPTASGLTPDDFFDSGDLVNDLLRVDVIRLLGVRSNAALVTRLTEARAKNRFLPKRITLCSPTTVARSTDRGDPTIVLLSLQQPDYAARRSGSSHELTPFDYPTYAMMLEVDALVAAGRTQSDLLGRLVQYHPAAPALCFPTDLDSFAACQLLCVIGDPRWYYHPKRPGRLNRLYAYLGLRPGCFGQTVRETPYGLRAAWATSAWCLTARDGTNEPGDYFYRLADASGLVRASRRFVEFVVRVWSDSCLPQPLRFDPLRFFGDPVVAARYRSCLESRRLAA